MNDKRYTRFSQVFNSESTTIIGKNILAGFLEKNGIMPYNPATAKSLKKIISLFSSPGQWIKVADASTIADFSIGHLNYSINSTTRYLELYIKGNLESKAWGVTNPINGKIILAPCLIDGIEHNFWAASVVIHEQDHFSNFKAGLYQGNSFITQELNELSAYKAAAKWTGSMERQGFIHLQNVIEYFLKLSNY
ncbi:hypothetical protein C1637_15250 [Chryseobacterium lactis]|nr:hypothetical protein [Chryseobacterium lactis]PNW13175.1 hypothetical protein C1637_15250 [Chryseobacterium lactis]